MGLFDKLFGKKEASVAPETDAEPDLPDAVVVLRRGMNVPSEAYLSHIIGSAYPSGLPEAVPRMGLSQPSWFKSDEAAEAIAAGVCETFSAKFQLREASARRRLLEGPDGCAVLLVELRGNKE